MTGVFVTPVSPYRPGIATHARPGSQPYPEPVRPDSKFTARRSSHADQFLVYKLADAQIGQFAAVAGVLHAAERKVRCRPGRLVDEDHSGLDLAGNALPPLDIFGDHRSAQPVRRVVSEVDRLFFILHTE